MEHDGDWALLQRITRRFVMAFQRIEALRESDSDVNALIADLTAQLSVGDDSPNARAKTEEYDSAM